MTLEEQILWLEKNAHLVHLDVNEHRVYYETVTDWLDRPENESEDEETRQACIAANAVAVVQVYPVTPIGFYRMVAPDLATAVRLAYEAVSKELAAETGSDTK